MSSSDRSTPRQTYVENAVRKKIVSGEWPPGSRLRTRAELYKEFGVSIVTLQRAFDQLAEEGFVEARGRSGTFVAESPPHISQFALAIPFDPDADAGRWSNFWDALTNEARALEEDYPYAILPYYGVGKHPDAEDYRMLVKEVEAHRVAGIIFATAPHLVIGTPLTDEPGIPHAAIMSCPSASSSSVAAVDPDVLSFYRSAHDHLADAGCRRVAIVAPNRLPMEEEVLRGWLDERGLETARHWIQLVSPFLEQGARRCAQLLMSNEADRPDGLIIADDNLVPPVTRGVSDAGVRVPEELEVVAHTNFPWPTRSAVPVQRIGFDVRQVLKECVERILEQRRGETPPVLTRLTARCEKEIHGDECRIETGASIRMS